MNKTEPVLTAAGLGALAAAIVALLVAFGVPLTDDQQKTILGLVAVLAPVGVAFVARRYVVPMTDVVEYQRADGMIAAGPANETAPTGSIVRAIGTMAVTLPDGTRVRAIDYETDPTADHLAQTRDYLAEARAELEADSEPLLPVDEDAPEPKRAED